MEVYNSSDIFQEKILELFQGFDEVKAYINNVLVIYDNHLVALEWFYKG